MGPNEKKFKQEYAPELFRIAQSDLVTAKALAQHPEVRPESVLLHCQQAIEKGLKSLLCFQGKPVPFTNELYAIVDRFREDLPPGGFDLQDLTPFATIRRYEEGQYEISTDEVAGAIEMVQAVLSWCSARMSK